MNLQELLGLAPKLADLFKISEPMRFNNATIPQSSTNIARSEEQRGIYNNQDSNIFNSPLLGQLKNAAGFNYQDAQVKAWQEGLKGGNIQRAAFFGNNPQASNSNILASVNPGGLESKAVSGSKLLSKVESKLNPLNFKTAEDYVRAHSLYHGTPNELVGGKLTFGAGNQLKKGGYMGGHFLTDTPEIADTFSFGGKVYQASGDIKNKVLDVNKSKDLFKNFIGKEYKTIDGEMVKFTKQEFDSIFPNGKADWATINSDLAEQLAKQQGKIGIAIPEYAAGKQGMTYQLFQDNIIVKTKQELIDIWNEAQTLKRPLIEQPKKLSIQEEYAQYQKEKRQKALERKKAFDSQLSPEELQRKKEDAATRKFFKGENKIFNIK